jgi:hypothetical protein
LGPCETQWAAVRLTASIVFRECQLAFILAIISFSIAKNRIDDMDGFKGILGSGIWLSLTAAVSDQTSWDLRSVIMTSIAPIRWLRLFLGLSDTPDLRDLPDVLRAL